jgi:hypothetical protein
LGAHTSDFLGTAILTILVVAANFTTFPQAQADRYDTLANRRDLREMYNSKRSAIEDHGTAGRLGCRARSPDTNSRRITAYQHRR